MHARARAAAVAAAGLTALAMASATLPAASAQSTVGDKPSAMIGSSTTAARAPGTSYSAATTLGMVSILFTHDRRGVRRAMFMDLALCSDGRALPVVQIWDALPLKPGRRFAGSFDSGPQADPLLPAISTRITASISGVRNKLGTKVVGSARFAAVTTIAEGTAITCDTGAIRFVAED